MLYNKIIVYMSTKPIQNITHFIYNSDIFQNMDSTSPISY